MKRCPECRRDYYDDSLLYCLDDGTALLEGPGSGSGVADHAPTVILHEIPTPADAGTQAHIHTNEHTEVFAGKAAHQWPRQFDRRLALAAAALVLVALIGYGGYRYLTPSDQIRSIAVMPFVNDSGNPEVEYLSDGMTETLIGTLSQLPNLSVKARSSVFRYKGKELDAHTIGTQLGVQAVLSGRVVQRGEQLALNLELIDAASENVIWSDSYNRRPGDLVSLQTEIARDVSSRLKSKLSGADAAKLERVYTSNSEAYQLYLKGRFQWNMRTDESLKQAAEHFKQAIGKDPNYALAYSGLAETYSLFTAYSVASAKDSWPLAKAASERALGFDETLPGAHAALAAYYIYFESDFKKGENELRRAIELDPNYATAHQWLGTDVLSTNRRFDEALVELHLAQEIDPLSPIIGTNLGDTLLQARRYDEALAQYKRTISLDPNFAYAHYSLSVTLYLKGMSTEAIAEARRAIELGRDPTAKGALALFLGKSGQRPEALRTLEELKTESSIRYVQPYALALAYLGLGDKEQALAFLEKEIADRSSNAIFFAVNHELDELRSEPRFKSMLRQLNLPE